MTDSSKEAKSASDGAGAAGEVKRDEKSGASAGDDKKDEKSGSIEVKLKPEGSPPQCAVFFEVRAANAMSIVLTCRGLAAQGMEQALRPTLFHRRHRQVCSHHRRHAS